MAISAKEMAAIKEKSKDIGTSIRVEQDGVVHILYLPLSVKQKISNLKPYLSVKVPLEGRLKIGNKMYRWSETVVLEIKE